MLYTTVADLIKTHILSLNTFSVKHIFFEKTKKYMNLIFLDGLSEVYPNSIISFKSQY